MNASPLMLPVFLGALLLSPLAAAYPVTHGDSRVLFAPYTRGDEVINHGGVTITSNGLGTWHVGLPLPASTDAPRSDSVVSTLPATPSSFGQFLPVGSPVATTALQLSEPTAWASLLPIALFLVMPGRTRGNRAASH